MSKQFRYIDVHGHPNFSAYDEDREDVIRRAEQAGTAMIAVGTQYETSLKALKLANAHESVYATVGLHPIHTGKSFHDEKELGGEGSGFTSKGEVPDKEAYLELAREPRVVAIGECGLDHYRLEPSSASKQASTFELMIDIANEVDKPLMLHIRDAYHDAIAILKARAKTAANVHFFAGTIDDAKEFLDLGCSFSFTGVITFARQYSDLVRYIPLDRIMSETDCPYVSPVPHRGKRNEPAYVVEVVKAIATIRDQPVTEVAEQLLENAVRFFKLDLA